MKNNRRMKQLRRQWAVLEAKKARKAEIDEAVTSHFREIVASSSDPEVIADNGKRMVARTTSGEWVPADLALSQPYRFPHFENIAWKFVQADSFVDSTVN